MKDVCDAFKMTNCHFKKNSSKTIGQSVFIIETSSLAIEMLHMKHGQSREVVSDTFTETTEEYNFRQKRDFRIPSVNTVYHRFESISYLGPKIWEIVPVKIN